MTLASSERLRGELNRLLHRGQGVREFSMSAARIVSRAVPFDGVCVVTMDPATMLPTGEITENGLPGSANARMIEIELGGEDFNSFRTLRRSGDIAAGLSDATGGDLNRSVRHRELKRPHGFGDELRAALVGDSATWGGLALLRASGRAPFSPDDASLVASLSRYFAEGLRRAMLLGALSSDGPVNTPTGGVVLLAADNSITRADPAAQMWLAELRDSGSWSDPVPSVVAAVANRARDITDASRTSEDVARARVRTASGTWLLVRGSRLGDGEDAETAVILEPARPHELAPLIAAAYGLTDRERAVTQLVAQGLSTSAIASQLHISPWTVQDHLKAIFEKVGAGTRGELVARVFFDHYAPRLSEGATLGADGWFAPAPAADGSPTDDH
ncbi:helix-turn-helix transcriptional regulator, partial [Aeromicrobium sp.]|uniref:helix-turn-helix transcriptional regulator n=1 Tax=Aeromicrobium sp. TaxID=1871063 RepID=UPI003C40AC7F